MSFGTDSSTLFIFVVVISILALLFCRTVCLCVFVCLSVCVFVCVALVCVTVCVCLSVCHVCVHVWCVLTLNWLGERLNTISTDIGVHDPAYVPGKF